MLRVIRTVAVIASPETGEKLLLQQIADFRQQLLIGSREPQAAVALPAFR